MKLKVLLTAVALAAFSTTAMAAPIVIKFSHTSIPSSTKGRAISYFKQIVEERTKGAVKVEVTPNGQLFKDSDEIAALQQGTVQMIAPRLENIADTLTLPQFEALGLPLLFANVGQVHDILSGDIGAQLLKLLETKQIHGLAFWDDGFKVMTANTPITRSSNFGNLKMGIRPSKVYEAQMRALGAIPQNTAITEAYQALKSGTINGFEETPARLNANKIVEVQKYLTVTNHGYQGYAVLTNNRFWTGLPADIRASLEKCMIDATKYANEAAEKANSQALENITKSGLVKVTASMENADSLNFRKRMYEVHKANATRIGNKLIEQLYKAAHYSVDLP